MSLADSFNSLLRAQNEEVADIMKIDKFDLKVTYSFNAGGTYSVDIDNDSLVQAVEGLKGEYEKQPARLFRSGDKKTRVLKYPLTKCWS